MTPILPTRSHPLSYRRPVTLLALTLVACLAAPVPIPSQIVALDPDKAGQDFPIQGEYLGRIDASGPALAAQVIANGNGKFTAVFLTGGLPGAGWDGSSRTEVQGALQSTQAVFSGTAYSGNIPLDGKVFSGQTAAGGKFTLEKTNRESPTLNLPPPTGAVVLFNGTDVSAWVPGTATMDSRKLMLPSGASSSAGATTVKSFRNFTLHLEFREPFMPEAVHQRRGNSGIYLQGRYEVQILDSFGKPITGEGALLDSTRICGAFWEMLRPSLNMCLPPLSWQTYDIDFKEAVWDAAGKQRVELATATVRFNGQIIHEKARLVNSTLAGDPNTPAAGPLRFQAYGDPVYYRNIWIVENNGAGVRPIRQRVPRNKFSSGRLQGARFSGLALSGRKVDGAPASGYYLPLDRAWAAPRVIW